MESNPQSTAATPDHRKVVKRALLAVGGAFFFCFSLIPIYSIYCEITGANGKTGQISGNDTPAMIDTSRTITVQFDGTSHSSLPWQFKPDVREMVVHPGELAGAVFYAQNLDEQILVGQAVPSVAPNVASIYFNKTECFCFTEQELAPGERREMPVRFVIDPDIPASVTTVTLSYTFFLNELATQRVAKEVAVNDNPAS